MSLCEKIQSLYKQFKKKYCKNEVIKESILPLKSLTPTSKIEDKSYLEILKWAIDNKEITNIALSGAYGSGKSSILKAFEENYDYLDKYKILNLSLATFKEKCDSLITNNANKDETEEKSNSFVDIDQEQIEKSILQQMMYKESPNTVPNSRFKRIHNPKNIFRNSSLIFLWIITIVELFTPYTILYPLSNYTASFVYWLYVIFLSGSIIISYYILKKTSNIKLQKLSLQSPEITLNENDSNISILNKHIDEIIYFFERTKYTVVVIEDLDRFNHPEIYIKLRELNKLLNLSKQIKQPINFVYAIRDNMFINKERTKFFDFFIPVIPVINATNSFTKLKKMFEDASLLEKMDERFLKDISRFVHDMRLLRNIFNEFVQYIEHLESNYKLNAKEQNNGELINIPNINYNEMFAIVVYKNHFPADFAKLHEQEGMVYKTFNVTDKETRLQELIKTDLNNINSLKKEIIRLNSVKKDSIRELRAEYVYQIIEKYPTLIAFYFDEPGQEYARVPIDKAIDDEKTFEILKNCKSFKYWYFTQPLNSNGINYTQINFDFTQIENELSTYSFDERVNNIEGLKQKQLKEEIKEIEDNIKKIKKSSIPELINIYNNQKILPYELYKDENKLLYYLIGYGHINEYYKQYISYYYPGNETLNDILFVNNIRNRVNEVDYKLELTQYDKVLADISDDEYLRTAILNFHLLNYLLKYNKKDIYITKIFNIIIVCKQHSKFDFIIGALDSIDNENRKSFINLLLIEWTDFINDYFSTEITYEEKDKIAYILIENINEFNKIKQLNSYIEEKTTLEDFIIRFNDAVKFIKYIKEQELKFSKLEDFNYDTSEVFRFIYENWNFKFNPHMIKVLIEADEEQFNTKNYTTILNSDKYELIKCIQHSFEQYINDVYLKIPENTKDTIDTLEYILNDSTLKKEIKLRVFEKTEVIFDKIQRLPQKLCEKAFIDNRISPTLSNIVAALNSEFINNDYIVDFITSNVNNFECDISYSTLDKKQKELFENILIDNKISINIFKLILEKLDYKFEIFYDINKLNDEKLDFLISNKYIQLNAYNYDPIRDDRNPNMKIKYFINEQNILLDCWDELCVLHDDIELLLQNENIDKSIKVHIITNQFDEEYINEFEFEDNTNKAIFELIINDIKEHLIQEYLYKHLIASNMSIDDKIKLFIQYRKFTRELIDYTLNSLGKPYSKLLHDGHRGKIKFKKTENNKLFLSKLRNMNYSGQINTNEENYEINKLIKKYDIIN
ncbi:hypothetical protein OZZ08_03865 [Malaciobacter mytili]|uniref:YobI family P-loop NTPase n=1 Tax=Malaciobacter mytili TaxID=603050 RepID=UPI003BAE1614